MDRRFFARSSRSGNAGESNRAEREELRISDAFETKDGCLEFTATMININKGHN